MIRKFANNIKTCLSQQIVWINKNNNYFLFSSTKMPDPKTKIAKLQNRSLLILQGPETYKLLQGLTTNDINLLTPKHPKSKIIDPQTKQFQDRVSLYTLFLGPKGKIITDAFIYKPKAFIKGKRQFRQDQLWIDVDSNTKKQLYFHLKKHMWKKKVQLIDVDNEQDQFKPSIYVGFVIFSFYRDQSHISTLSLYQNQGCQMPPPKQQYFQDQYSSLMMFDPRGGNFGRRILCMKEQFGIPLQDFQLVKQKNFQQFQKLIGFTPSTLTTNKLPFQFNFDFFKAISFNKGCYLGQEIVSRSYFTGIVRKRVFPFQIQKQKNKQNTKQLDQLAQGAKLYDKQEKQIGKVIWCQQSDLNTGLALVSYLDYSKPIQPAQNQPNPTNPAFNQAQTNAQSNNPKFSLSIDIHKPFYGTIYCPFPQQLSKYLTQTKQKQQKLELLDI